MSDDLIRRQDAIDALATIGYDFSDSGLSQVELEELCEAVGDVRQDMINRIKRMPSAEPDQKWIPADNPPETDDYILLSFENYSVPMVGRYEDFNYYVGDETEPLCKQDIFVNAWMPLPEPYKEWRTDEVD